MVGRDVLYSAKAMGKGLDTKCPVWRGDAEEAIRRKQVTAASQETSRITKVLDDLSGHDQIKPLTIEVPEVEILGIRSNQSIKAELITQTIQTLLVKIAAPQLSSGHCKPRVQESS
jgi:hypothetical protein